MRTDRISKCVPHVKPSGDGMTRQGECMTTATCDMTTFFSKTSYRAISGHTRHTCHWNADMLVRIASCYQILIIVDKSVHVPSEIA